MSQPKSAQMTEESRNSTYWRSPLILLATTASLVFVGLAVRTMLDPVAASAAFGLPLGSGGDASFVRVYGSRNFVLGLLGFTLIASRMTKATTLLFAFAAILPPIDMWIVVSRIGVGPELIRHAIIFLILSVMAGALWHRFGRSDETRTFPS
jgi:Domain of unknown function (DUF4267)